MSKKPHRECQELQPCWDGGQRGDSQAETGVRRQGNASWGNSRGAGCDGNSKMLVWLEILCGTWTAELTLQKLSLQQSLPEAAPEVK